MKSTELIKFLGLCVEAGETLTEVYAYLEAAEDSEDGPEGMLELTAEQRMADYKLYNQIE